MQYMFTLSASAAVLLLGSHTTALPLGDDGSTDMGKQKYISVDMTQPAIAAHTSKDFSTSYFFCEKYSSAITTHITLLVLGWRFVLPIVGMLRTSRSRLAVPSQIPDLDLYKSNLHRTLGWIATCVISVQVSLALIFAHAGHGKSNPPPYECAAFLQCSIEEHEKVGLNGTMHGSCWVFESIQGTVGAKCSVIHSSVSPYYEQTAGQSGREKPKELPAKVTGTRESSTKHNSKPL
ncbi:hypothetical protein DTO027I6_9868 [Penicillium roqueforti]|nr:hypothetical protein CBS147337_10071 [Penicillium roqueforti]KAI3185013.1 hypothetical protein DTO027I6_9868 [Penicillium roqueforti]